MGGPRAALGQPQRGAEQHQRADRDVDQQHPAPGQIAGEQAADQAARRAAARADRRPRTDRPGPLGPLGKGRGEDRQRGGRQHGRADALHGPGRDQHPGVLREPARETGGGEEREPDQEDPLAPEEVGGPAAQQQESGEGQRVGVDHPLQPGLAEVQIGAHGRQRHVHHGHVEDDEELPGADREQHRPRRSGAALVPLPPPVRRRSPTSSLMGAMLHPRPAGASGFRPAPAVRTTGARGPRPPTTVLGPRTPVPYALVRESRTPWSIGPRAAVHRVGA